MVDITHPASTGRSRNSTLFLEALMKQTQEEKKKTNLNSVVGVENGSLFVLTEKRINETYQQSMNPPLNALSFIKFRNKFAYEFFMRFVFFRVEMEADRMLNRVLVSNISKKVFSIFLV